MKTKTVYWFLIFGCGAKVFVIKYELIVVCVERNEYGFCLTCTKNWFRMAFFLPVNHLISNVMKWFMIKT